MKVALMCQSLLLSKSLNIFLKNSISPYKKCDFVISDQKLELDKPQFIISNEDSNLKSPFSESTLMIELDKFYNNVCLNNRAVSDASKSSRDNKKRKIKLLLDKFRDDIMDIIDE